MHFIERTLWRRPPEMPTTEWQEQSSQLVSTHNARDALDEKETGEKRHKCLAERQKPIPEQCGAVRC